MICSYGVKEVCFKDLRGEEELILCADDRDLRSVKQKLGQGADMNVSSASGETTFWFHCG